MVADQAAVAHEPAEGPFDDPAAGEHMEAFGLGGALDDSGLQFRAKFPDGAGELRTGVAAVDPELPEPGEPAEQRSQEQQRAGPFRGAGPGAALTPRRRPRVSTRRWRFCGP